MNVWARSDHYPIFLLVDPTSLKKNFPFCFEKVWILHPGLETLINEWWNIKFDGSAMFRVAKKLRNVKDNIKKWNRDTFGNIFENKRKIIKKIKVL